MFGITLSKREWRFISFLSLLAIIFTTAPFLYGWLHTPEGYRYTGLHFLSPADYSFYYSFLWQVKEGSWLFDNLFTWIPVSHQILNIFWLFLGLIGRILHTNPLLTFHIGRIISIPIFVAVAYVVIAYYFSDEKKRKLAALCMVFSGGLGALLSGVIEPLVQDSAHRYNWPMDLWAADANIFLTLFSSPHLIVSMTLLILVLFLFLLSVTRDKVVYSTISGIFALLFFNFHSFHAITIWAIVAVFLLVRSLSQKRFLWSQLRHGVILFFLSLPSVLYQAYLVFTDPVMQSKSQLVLLTPNVLITILSFGFMIPFAVIGVRVIFKNHQWYTDRFLFLLCWLLAQAVFVYLPFPFQRRLFEGWQIPLVFL